MISLLVAHDPNRVIGMNNDLPWHIPEDLAYFKKVSMGKAMVMGRKTFESIGRPLPGRLSIIVTRNEAYTAEGAVVVHNLNDAIARAEEYADEVMIIGGAEIFHAALVIADRLYITYIQKQYEGDTFFLHMALNGSSYRLRKNTVQKMKFRIHFSCTKRNN